MFDYALSFLSRRAGLEIFSSKVNPSMNHKSLFLDDYSLTTILRIPKSLPICMRISINCCFHCSAVYIINYSCNECENHFSQSQS